MKEINKPIQDNFRIFRLQSTVLSIKIWIEIGFPFNTVPTDMDDGKLWYCMYWESSENENKIFELLLGQLHAEVLINRLSLQVAGDHFRMPQPLCCHLTGAPRWWVHRVVTAQGLLGNWSARPWGRSQGCLVGWWLLLWSQSRPSGVKTIAQWCAFYPRGHSQGCLVGWWLLLWSQSRPSGINTSSVMCNLSPGPQ